MSKVQVKRCLVGVMAADFWEWSSISFLSFLIKRFNVQKESFILPEKVIVRDPQGNGYVIESVLGKGEFGAVYLVRERGKTRNLFALKEVINPDKNERERFAFEGEVLKRLNHRALPRVHRVFENDKLKRVYLLMDYIQGRNLEDLRGEQPGKCFPLPFVLVLMAPIVDALMYLHAQDPPIVHRDIKPANIIVPLRGGEAVLADFGSAKEYVPGSATTVVGHRSPGYAALEQYRTGTNTSTDIYGLGATLYALLTGFIPIDALSRVLGSVSEGVDPLKPANLLQPTVPLAVAEALQRAMSIRSADRFETVEEFWQVFMAHRTQQIAATTWVDLTQPAPSTQVYQESATESLQEEQVAAHAKTRKIFRIFTILLLILAIGTAFFSYLRGFTVLLLCCLGMLLLSLGVLLGDVYSQVRTQQKKQVKTSA
jgi:serine/threonine protein kinase